MLPEHKNPIFVSKRPKISEKTPILTQECQFCARKAVKWGSRSQKAHKNADFVLGGPHRTARSSSAEHGTARRGPARQGTTTRNGTRQPGTKRNGPKHNETQPPRNTTATQRTQHTQPPRNATATQRKRHAMQYTKRNRCGNAKEPLRNGTTKKETTFQIVSFKNWRLPTLPHGSAVPSAQVSLTSLFGMGRGGSSPLLPP